MLLAYTQQPQQQQQQQLQQQQLQHVANAICICISIAFCIVWCLFCFVCLLFCYCYCCCFCLLLLVAYLHPYTAAFAFDDADPVFVDPLPVAKLPELPAVASCHVATLPAARCVLFWPLWSHPPTTNPSYTDLEVHRNNIGVGLWTVFSQK